MRRGEKWYKEENTYVQWMKMSVLLANLSIESDGIRLRRRKKSMFRAGTLEGDDSHDSDGTKCEDNHPKIQMNNCNFEFSWADLGLHARNVEHLQLFGDINKKDTDICWATIQPTCVEAMRMLTDNDADNNMWRVPHIQHKLTLINGKQLSHTIFSKAFEHSTHHRKLIKMLLREICSHYECSSK